MLFISGTQNNGCRSKGAMEQCYLTNLLKSVYTFSTCHTHIPHVQWWIEQSENYANLRFMQNWKVLNHVIIAWILIVETTNKNEWWVSKSGVTQFENKIKMLHILRAQFTVPANYQSQQSLALLHLNFRYFKKKYNIGKTKLFLKVWYINSQ
jgi:hypothetical protein